MRNKSYKAKLNLASSSKATSEKERIQLWHDHFKYLLGKPTPISTYNESIEQVNDQLDMKTGIFTAYELKQAIKSIQNGKAVCLDEIPAEL